MLDFEDVGAVGRFTKHKAWTLDIDDAGAEGGHVVELWKARFLLYFEEKEPGERVSGCRVGVGLGGRGSIGK